MEKFLQQILGKLLRLEDGEKRKRLAALYANGKTLDVGHDSKSE